MTLITRALEESTVNFQDAMAQAIDSTSWTELRVVKLGATIGDDTLVAVPAGKRKHGHECYFTELDGSSYGIVINSKAGWTPGQLVEIGHPPNDKKNWYVHGALITPEVNPVTNAPGVAPHAPQHSLRNLGHDGGAYTGRVGEDPVLIDSRQIYDVNVYDDSDQDAGTIVVRITPGWIVFGEELLWFNGDVSADLTSSVPANPGDARYVLVTIDRDLAVHYTVGDLFGMHYATGSRDDYVPAGAAGHYHAATLCLRKDMPRVTYAHTWSGMGLRTVPPPYGLLPETVSRTFTIPAGFQCQWIRDLTVTGMMTVEGSLYVLP